MSLKVNASKFPKKKLFTHQITKFEHPTNSIICTSRTKLNNRNNKLYIIQ